MASGHDFIQLAGTMASKADLLQLVSTMTCQLCESVKMPYDHLHKAMLLDELFDTVRAMEELPWTLSILNDLDSLDHEELLEVLRQVPGRTYRLHLNVLPQSLRQLALAFQQEPLQIAAAAKSAISKERALQTFTLFPDLPPEIRLMIWGHALPGPTTIEVFSNQRTSTPKISGHVQKLLAPLRRTCQEARSVVDKHYQQLPRSMFNVADDGIDRAKFYFNPRDNVVYLNGYMTTFSLLATYNHNVTVDRQALKCIAVNYTAFETVVLLPDETFPYCFGTLPNLEKILVVMNDDPEVANSHYEGREVEFQSTNDLVLPKSSLSLKAPREYTRAWEFYLKSKSSRKTLAHIKLEFVILKRKDPPRLLSDKIHELSKASRAIHHSQF
ncbi:hypothetical protein B0J14DRAFT_569715 [Halenospora varia]|nr:hypothetical protein B0J14DRAFT_569715 [Halenospora varia]